MFNEDATPTRNINLTDQFDRFIADQSGVTESFGARRGHRYRRRAAIGVLRALHDARDLGAVFPESMTQREAVWQAVSYIQPRAQ